MTRKPITEHLNDLPEEYREEALELYEATRNANREYESQSDALLYAFPWFDSRWLDRYNDLKSKGL